MEIVDYVFLGVGLLCLFSVALEFRTYSRETRNHKYPHVPTLKEFWRLCGKGPKFNTFLGVLYLSIGVLGKIG